MVRDCRLARLLCERQGTEELVRSDVERHGAASRLNVHLVRIRSVDLPASVQVADDARALLAIRTCVERRRTCNRSAWDHAGETALGH